jgi:toxin ParE1/3/4
VKFGYVIRPKADRDIDDLADYIVEHGSLDTALTFLSEAYEAFALIASHPEMGWHCKVKLPQLKTARTFRVSERFGDYLIFYQPFEDRIEIIRVVHGSQDLVELFRNGDD